MNPSDVSTTTKFKVGIFTVTGIVLTGLITVFVNDRPYWWRDCQLVNINITDGTGLKNKSPVRSLGIQIGHIKSVELYEQHLKLGICLTLPIEVLPETRAYIRGEGFLGDKFVELKPVRYVGSDRVAEPGDADVPATSGSSEKDSSVPSEATKKPPSTSWLDWLIPSAHAVDSKPKAKQIPVGSDGQDVSKLMERVDGLVDQLTKLTTGVKDALDPNELKDTVKQLNLALKNAAETLSPKGNLTTTAQRALLRLEDAIEQLRQILTRINQGEGSIGQFINDPTYADEIRKAVKNVNRLLNKVEGMRFVVDIGGQSMPAYDGGGRGWVQLGIWPVADRYYLLGVAIDPRGTITRRSTQTQVGTTLTETKTKEVNYGGIQITAMLGKVLFDRLELAAGIYHSDGTIRTALRLGPSHAVDRIQLINDLYFYSDGIDNSSVLHDRVKAMIFPSGSPYLESFYVTGGLETFRKVEGKTAYFFGAGLQFDDEDIKLMFGLL